MEKTENDVALERIKEECDVSLSALIAEVKTYLRYKYAHIGPRGVRLELDDSDQALRSYRSLCKAFQGADVSSGSAKCLRNFYIGDTLNQAEEIFGESYACVLGTDLKLSEKSISNIRWCARNIDEDVRQPYKVPNWRLHCDVAPMDRDRQEYYLERAAELVGIYPYEYLRRIREVIKSDKIASLIGNVEDPDQQKFWLEIIDARDPTPTQLEKWITGEEPVPPMPVDASLWIERALADGDVEDYRELMYQLASGIKEGLIKVK